MASEDKLRSYLKRVTADLHRANQRVQELESQAAEPIAVVGIGCRFPGGVRTPEDLWTLLQSGTDATTLFPTNRDWDPNLYHPDPEHPGTSSTRHGAFLHDAADFDPEFFGISPREALTIDPQQRLLLETAWEAIEHAHINPHTLRNTTTATYTGIMYNDYATRHHPTPTHHQGHLHTNSAPSIASGRINYTLHLTGPAITIDTACSSSLVATHLATQALHHHHTDLALAGGATIMATPTLYTEFTPQHALAPNGQSKPFAATADGAGFAEGVALLLLERLTDAQKNGHRILALIRGSAINQDGASSQLTAPNGPAQQHVITQALTNAGLQPADIDAVEAHGTGTTLGDPIEAQALHAVYGPEHTETPLYLGSIKSNIGHTQAAAGTAGIIKMILAMQHGILPKSLHIDEPTPHVDWSDNTLHLLTEHQPWPETNHPRRAAISSFGISGTNAHLILEQAPTPVQAPQLSQDSVERPAILVLSGRTDAALRDQAINLRTYLDQHPDVPLPALAQTLEHGRSHFTTRAAILATTHDQALTALQAMTRGEEHPDVHTHATTTPGKVAFVFPGQGSQWTGMGLQLAERFPAYRRALDECDQALRPYTGRPLNEILADPTTAERVEYLQPALFATMVALARLWQHHGIQPNAVIGHSQGEIAAAHIADALTLEQAAAIVALRAKALTQLAGTGGMALVTADPDYLNTLLASEPELHIAAYNGPHTTILAGTPTAISALIEAEERARRIAVDYASHTDHIDRLNLELPTITPGEANVPFYSTLTGTRLSASELTTDYWRRNLREPVRFHQALTALLNDGHSTLIETSPHPVLTHVLDDILTEHSTTIPIHVTGTLRRDQSDTVEFLTALAGLHIHGHRPALNPEESDTTPIPALPTYPFQRQTYWLHTSPTTTPPTTDHPHLTHHHTTPDGAIHLTGQLNLETESWLNDHALHDTPLFPATGFLELTLYAATNHTTQSHIQELTLHSPLILAQPVELHLTIHPTEDDNTRTLTIHTRPINQPDTDWLHHATAHLTTPDDSTPEPEAVSGGDATPIDLTDFYPTLADHGYTYGPTFQALQTATQHPDHTIRSRTLLTTQSPSTHTIHPALLDAALHPLILNTLNAGDHQTRVPFSWHDIRLHTTQPTALHTVITPDENGNVSLRAFDRTGQPVLTVGTLVIRPISTRQLTAHRAATDSLYRLDWTAVATEPAQQTPNAVMLPVDGASDDVREVVGDVLQQIQEWLSQETVDASNRLLVVLTHGAVATHPGEHLTHLAGAAVWGLVRAVQTEHPGRIVLIDLDDDDASERALSDALGTGEPQIAIRSGKVMAARLVQIRSDELMTTPPDVDNWRLDLTAPGTTDNLVLVPDPELSVPPEPRQVRIAVRAAGLNFRDALLTLGMVRDPGRRLGGEVAGVVAEVGQEVTAFKPGDRVFGLVSGTGTLVQADERLVAPMPDTWTFAEAATVPVAFLTAYYGLVDLADLQPGESVLIHAATGGVGMAAVQLAQHLGAEVFATASPGKWCTLRAMDLDDRHIASSRQLGFERDFRAAADGRGVDVVLNSLAREFVDESLDLLEPGGRFLEMGKTDIRKAGRPGTSYQAYDLLDAGPDRTREIFAELLTLFKTGALNPLPLTAWDILRARDAVKFLSQARHIGKLVLQVDRPLAADGVGTVLVTGANGTLGRLVARHLVTEHGVRRLLLASRRGPAAEGAEEFTHELAELGAEAIIVACDAADRDALATLLAGIPTEQPLVGVVHAAGVLDDTLVEKMTREQLDRVLAPKVTAAWNLHDLTRHLDLSMFVLFSSAAGVLGNPGQANYAAANAYLDALAQVRRAQGLPATALAWGLWAESSGMTAHLRQADLTRMSRSGLTPLSSELGLELFDAGLSSGLAATVPIRLDLAALQATGGGHADAANVPHILRGLVRGPSRIASSAPVPGRLLADLPVEEREAAILTLIRTQAAIALGHTTQDSINADQTFKEAGVDSLIAVELRNRLTQATGVRLPATLVFDFPTPTALAARLRTSLFPETEPAEPVDPAEAAVRSTLAAIPLDRLRAAGLLDLLLSLGEQDDAAPDSQSAQESIDDMDTDNLVRLALDGNSI